MRGRVDRWVWTHAFSSRSETYIPSKIDVAGSKSVSVWRASNNGFLCARFKSTHFVHFRLFCWDYTSNSNVHRLKTLFWWWEFFVQFIVGPWLFFSTLISLWFCVFSSHFVFLFSTWFKCVRISLSVQPLMATLHTFDGGGGNWHFKSNFYFHVMK